MEDCHKSPMLEINQSHYKNHQPYTNFKLFGECVQESTVMSLYGTPNVTEDAFELSSSSSKSDLTMGDITVNSRLKLRTRRNKANVSGNNTSDSSDVERPAKRRRDMTRQIQYYENEGDLEEDEVEGIDEDETEDYVDQERETESEDEKLSEKYPNRRRSGRKRKSMQSVIDLSYDSYVLNTDEEDERANVKPKSKQRASAKAKTKEKVKRKNSLSDSDEADSEEDSEMSENVPESDGFVIGKVLACETHTQREWKKMCWNKNTRFLTHSSIFLPSDDEEEEDNEEEIFSSHVQRTGKRHATTKREGRAAIKESIDVDDIEDAGEERFLIKWKTLSYLHTSWQTEEELLETDKLAKGKIQRFREKKLGTLYSQDIQGDEYFNPEFRSVDRILELRDKPLDDFVPDDAVEGESKCQFVLVKWKALPYDEITWEREDDVGDDAAMKQYNARIVRAAKRYKKIALAKHLPQNKRKNFRGYTADSPPPCRKEQNLLLRDYQLTGVNWLLFNWYQKRNSMLADEMGLGKTVQTVMYINHLAVVELTPQPFIIVAPLSTLGHWQREFDSWTNLNAVVYHGSAAARDVLQNYEFFISKNELLHAAELTGHSSNSKLSTSRPKRKCYRFDVLITTFEMACATDLYKLAQINWQLMVVDEAHRLKNRNSKLSNILHTRYTYENMLLLTGTPLQNNVEELWVLLNFLDGDKFASKDKFLENFGELTDSAQVDRLHTELKPYILRRMKEDVEKSLAPKEETIIEVELTVLQKQYYRAIYEKNTEFLSRGSKKGDTPSLMNVLMELRKCCNHPFLVRGVEEREVKRLTKQKDVSKEEIQRQIRESLVDTAGKLTLLDKLLPRLKDNGHRVLIFSQFKIMLDILQDYLALRRYNCERIDGNITGNERQSAIDRFSREDSTSFIMLLSTRAGGVGINLTAADTVIIYDSDWNPQNDLQAQARCHRIGQKKSVKIYRLLTAKTYELHMFHTASLKLGLDQAVLGGIKNDDPVAKLKGTAKSSKTNDRMSKEEIENLLKHGAYEIFKEQDSEAEAASKQFSEESIDQILSRSTTIVHDPTRGNGNETKSVMSSFSKATFVSSTNPDEEVDVDDPNFWTKVIGLNGVEEQKKTEPSPLQKRRCRRKVKSYLTDDDKTYMIDGSEDERACRKKLFRGMEVQKDEEFVISNEDDDDDDDMSNSSMTEDDHSVDNKRKRTQLLNIPIFHHVERIIELLGSFGYGRWDDMKRHCSTLQAYPNAELIQFAQKFVTGMVRVMTATTTFERIGLGLEPSRVYIVSSTPPPLLMGSASPIERYAYELNVSARRFPFLLAMMKDMQVENLLAVAVPPSLWLTDYQSRTARGFRTKLQQIDIMYRLSEFVQLNFSKAPALVHTIECLQSIGNEAVVQNMIESGTVPPLPVELPIKQKETVKPASEIETFKKTEVVSVEDTASKDEKAAVTTDRNPIASTLSSKSEKLDEAECKMISSAEVATHDNHTISQSDEVKSVEKNDETIDMSSEKHLAIEKYSKTPPDCVNIPGSGPTQTPTETSDDKNEKNVDTLSCENKFIPRNTGAENESDSSLRENAGSGPAKEPIVQGKSGPLAENERMQAMRILGSLPPVNSPELVAPWWISRVDDVMLLIHVYREGWVKGRGIPSQMVNISTLFGHRAKCYPTSKWPSMAILNRRLKLLLHLWTSTKSTSIAPSTTSIATALNLTTSKLQRQQQLLDLQQKLQHQLEHQRVPHAKMSANNVRHNQFAKLVFSFGIPDVSTCQDMRERNEKWRYFLQDSQLNIGHCSLEELLAEAHDLERVCRHRLRAAADRQIISMFSNEDSILGGKRGFWLLTTTQCRRLVHRIDLFRLLRTQILILPPAQLVEVVARVVRVQSVSTEYPAWWSSPRHDILLLQGVECYGLDEHLASVWKLPLFSSANTTNSNPGFSWVENYVTALALTCRNLLIKVLKNRAERLIDLSNDDTEISRSRPSRNQESETVRRIRDIGAMRKEDPHVVPSVRLRQIFESNTSQREKRREELSPVKLNPIKSLLMPEEETALMQLEDPCFSTHVRAIWAKQKKHDEIKDANAHSALSCKASSDALEDTVDRNGSSTQDMEMTSPSSKNKGNNDSGKVAKEVHVSMSKRPVRAAAVAAISKLNNSRISSSGKSQDLDVASDKVTVAKSEPKKSVQSWNVIVIDSSDDSD